jgi:hypothetical protein
MRGDLTVAVWKDRHAAYSWGFTVVGIWSSLIKGWMANSMWKFTKNECFHLLDILLLLVDANYLVELLNSPQSGM